MPRRAAGPDQVGRDHRLAVAGREGVQRPPARTRRAAAAAATPSPAAACAKHAGEAVLGAPSPARPGAAVAARRACPSPGAHREASPRAGRAGCRAAPRDSARSPVGRVVGGNARAHGGAGAGPRDDRLPALTARRRSRRAAHGSTARGHGRRAAEAPPAWWRSPPWPAGKLSAAPGREGQGDGSPVDLQRAARGAASARLRGEHPLGCDGRAPGRSGSPPGRARSVTSTRSPETATRVGWFTEKLPSGCARGGRRARARPAASDDAGERASSHAP